MAAPDCVLCTCTGSTSLCCTTIYCILCDQYKYGGSNLFPTDQIRCFLILSLSVNFGLQLMKWPIICCCAVLTLPEIANMPCATPFAMCKISGAPFAAPPPTPRLTAPLQRLRPRRGGPAPPPAMRGSAAVGAAGTTLGDSHRLQQCELRWQCSGAAWRRRARARGRAARRHKESAKHRKRWRSGSVRRSPARHEL